MEIIHGTTDILLRPSVATIGFFDGVHLGHRYLIEQVKEEAALSGMASAVITFPVHPRKVMHTDYQPELLTTYEERLEMISSTGIDYCIIIDFTPEIAALSAQQFMDNILRKQYRVSGLVIGYDHRFGRDRSEGFDDYCRFGKELGINIVRARAYTIDNEITISSSMIRRLLHTGDVQLADRFLGYNYILQGIVTGGHQIGRTLGFPTANLYIEDKYKLVPQDGVYAIHVTVQGITYNGMLNIGHRPTINNGKDRSIEVHILDFNSDIYNFPIKISFIKFIRAEMKFAGKDDLRIQLEKDRIAVKSVLDLSL